MRKRRMVWAAFGVALLSLALSGTMVAGAAAQSGGTPWLGVTTQDITSELREGLDYQGSGVIVNQVVTDSPADRAGIRKGDVIVSVNSRVIDSASELVDVVRAARIGQAVAVSVVRDGSRRSLTARLAERPDTIDEQIEDSSPESDSWPSVPQPPRAPRAPRAPRTPSTPRSYSFSWDGGDFDFDNGAGMTLLRSMGRGRLGVQVQNVNGDLGEALGVPEGKGVLVTEVVDDTPAQRAGIKAGDVITRVDDRAVEDIDDLHRALGDKEGRVTVTVQRKGARRTVQAELEARKDVRRQVVRIPGNGSTLLRIPDIRARVLRDRADTDAGDGDLEKQMRVLREELRELRKKLEAMDKK